MCFGYLALSNCRDLARGVCDLNEECSLPASPLRQFSPPMGVFPVFAIVSKKHPGEGGNGALKSHGMLLSKSDFSLPGGEPVSEAGRGLAHGASVDVSTRGHQSHVSLRAVHVSHVFFGRFQQRGTYPSSGALPPYRGVNHPFSSPIVPSPEPPPPPQPILPGLKQLSEMDYKE